MFKVKSFIHIPGREITDINIISLNPDSYFIDVEETQKLIEISSAIDFNYLSGAIHLEYFDHPIMDFKLWDLVDQLWAYILNVIEDFFDNGKGITYFPDQPIELEISELSKELILFKLDNGNIANSSFPKKDFVKSLLDGAESFYLNINKAFNEKCDFSFELEKISELRTKLV